MYFMSSQNLETTYKVKKFLSSDSVIGQSGCNQIPVIRQLKQPIIPSPPNTESIFLADIFFPINCFFLLGNCNGYDQLEAGRHIVHFGP